MNKINLTIDADELLPDLEWDPETGPTGSPGAPLQNLVIEAAARQILRTETFDHEVREALRGRIQAEVDQQVGDLVREAIEQPFNITSQWGDVKEANVTVRDVIRRAIEKWFSAKPTQSNSYGNPDKNSIHTLITDVTRNVMDKELKAEVDRVRKEVGTQIRDKALRAAVEAISPRSI